MEIHVIYKKNPIQISVVRSPGPAQIAYQMRGMPGRGLPVGGAVGQTVRKRSVADYDAEWADSDAVANIDDGYF
jgi:hypothetical protein